MEKEREYEYYENVKNWDFSMINFEVEKVTDWSFFGILNELAKPTDKILDLGTGGGEKLLQKFPEVREILGTDYSEGMIETANENLKKSGRKNITFRVMDNTKMDTPDEYYDIVVARNTVIDPKAIYKTLKKGGTLLVHDVDKLDCWQLIRLFGCGQGYEDKKSIGQVEYERILDAGFKDVEMIPLYEREYFKSKEDLLALLLKTPILGEKRNNIDMKLLDSYIENNTYEKGILLRRHLCAIIAKK